MKDVSKGWNKMIARNGISTTHRECIAQGPNKFSKETNSNNKQSKQIKRNDPDLIQSTFYEKTELSSSNGEIISTKRNYDLPNADKKSTKKNFEKEHETIRLNKFLSHNSNYSRREADKLINDGLVKVNNKTITDLSTKVKTTDKVEIGKKIIKEDKNRIYTVIVYNKPKGEIVSKNDPQGRKTIYDSLETKYKHFVSVGRLDYASEGLLLLSDNVDIVNKLMHSDLQRVYKIKVNGLITPKIEEAMQKGLTIKDATKGAYNKTKIKSMSFAPFIAYDIQSNGIKFSKIKVIINEGKNRELRRFFAHFNLDVLDLKRLEYGGISLNNLPTGKSRFLTKEEYKNLRIFMNEYDRSI